MAIFDTNTALLMIPGLTTMDINNLLPISNQTLKLNNIQSILLNLHDGTGGLNNIHNLTRLTLQKNKPKLGSAAASAGIQVATDVLTDKINPFKNDNSEFGRAMGTLFSLGVSSAGNNMADNLIKGAGLTEGLSKNVGSSLAGAGAGLAANYIGQGITSAMGDSRLGRAVGLGVSTGLGTLGGAVASNLINGTKTTFLGSGLFSKVGAGAINPYALGATVLGSALGAAAGPSKEYGGRHGNITQTMDTAYDLISAGVNFIPGVGQGISAAMVLNKGLSNIFGSTDGMTVQDAILGSAFMPAPVKWLNMWGSSKTGTFNNLSWQNSEKANSFMGSSFGNLNDRFDQAREEAGKTYGTFSQGAKREALKNIDFANRAWGQILNMADLNEYQNIRSQAMSSINNQRYAQMIQGGWNPIYIGKQGMKIFNNATNHNIGMRLLSGAALIDNKAMILSAQGGTKVMRPRKKPHRKGEQAVYTEEELRQQAEWDAHLEEIRKQQTEEQTRKLKLREEAATKFNLQTNTIMGAMTLQANETPFTGLEYQQAAEDLRQKKVEKFHEAEKVGEAALMADLAVSAAPLLQRGFRWVFNKTGLLVKVPVNKFTTAKSVYTQGNMTPTEVLQSTGKGISDVYKTYSPGGAWYQRLLANGIPKELVDKLATEYLNNLRKTTFKISDSPLSDAVAVTGGEIRNGEFIPKITMDPRYAPNTLLVRSAASHEGGHASTLNLEPKNSPYRESENERFYLLVEESNPETTKAMEYNETLRPEIKDSALDEILLDETGNAEKHINNVISTLEIRQRALTSEIDAANKGVSMEEYINNPNLWDLNFKLLMEIFEKEGIKNYMKHFKSLIPTTIGGSTAATLYNKSK